MMEAALKILNPKGKKNKRCMQIERRKGTQIFSMIPLVPKVEKVIKGRSVVTAIMGTIQNHPA
jgi:hypothetical protein